MRLDDLREAMVGKYAPAVRPFDQETFFEEFRRKEFEEGDVAETFHENSRLTPVAREKLNRSASAFGDGPAADAHAHIAPDYAERERIDLPDPDLSTDREFAELLAQRESVRSFSGAAVSQATLSNLLWAASGVTRRDPESGKEFRTHPSAGAMYPIETYVGVLDGEDLDPGLYYYHASAHALRVLRTGESVADDLREAFAGDAIDVANAGAVFALTGAFWRSKAKYGPRGYRYALLEAGHVAQNLYLACSAFGLGCVGVGGFYDDALNDALDVDGVNEAAVYALVVGDPER
ncbi:SagB/ThcOx family dehydrogenase [Halorussus pelagicus]|uniref:SagB/ThcOx family dehydrogenase n=1 Tax=Halorussus pelagicus TaxID=2505977 RepID=UPI0014077C05|nr:SagB/ThcOx family dehydrogenase [Halorussus pelagicus]